MRMTAATRAAVIDAAWALAQRLGEFGYAEIEAELSISKDRVPRIVRQWEAEGSIEKIESGHRLRHKWRVRPEGRARRPELRGSVPLNLWTAMRGLKTFTPTDLAAHATVDDLTVTVEAAAGYCQTLLRAGYLRVERKAVPGRVEPVYRLVRVTGPRPPREKRVRAVYDENLGEIVHVGDRAVRDAFGGGDR